jgi:ABC-2 type transport system permease protein
VTWETVARKEFDDAVRTSALWLVVGLVGVLVVGTALYVAAAVLGSPNASGTQRGWLVTIVVFLRPLMQWLLPITAVLLGYRAIAGERETGQLKLLLSLPHERRDVLVGKLLGASAVLVAAVVGSLSAAALIGLVVTGQFGVVAYVVLVGATVAFAMAYVSIALAFSAAASTASRAATGAVGTFVFFNFAWAIVPNGLHFLLRGSVAPSGGAAPPWFVLAQRLSPGGAYHGVTTLFEGTGGLLASGVPVYRAWWVAAVILAAWVAIPAWLGYRRFLAADL